MRQKSPFSTPSSGGPEASELLLRLLVQQQREKFLRERSSSATLFRHLRSIIAMPRSPTSHPQGTGTGHLLRARRREASNLRKNQTVERHSAQQWENAGAQEGPPKTISKSKKQNTNYSQAPQQETERQSRTKTGRPLSGGLHQRRPTQCPRGGGRRRKSS